jgi:Transposase, Mutator family
MSDEFAGAVDEQLVRQLAGRDGGNSRNGKRAKTVLTDIGPVQPEVPRDRDASFEPRIAAKRQRLLAGVNDLVVSQDTQPRPPAGGTGLCRHPRPGCLTPAVIQGLPPVTGRGSLPRAQLRSLFSVQSTVTSLIGHSGCGWDLPGAKWGASMLSASCCRQCSSNSLRDGLDSDVA